MNKKFLNIFIIVYGLIHFYPFPYFYLFNTINGYSLIIFIIFLYYIRGLKMRILLFAIAITYSFFLNFLFFSPHVSIIRTDVLGVSYYEVSKFLSDDFMIYKQYSNIPIYIKKDVEKSKGLYSFIKNDPPEKVMARFCDLKRYCE